MKTIRRNKNGSMFLLILSVTILIFIPLFIMIGQMGPIFVSSGKAQNVVEAAGLLAAKDLSQIILDDPNFGFISLSNHPAEGSATKAKDGEPLPVIGINTLISTLRQNAIIADKLHNETMDSLVDADIKSLTKTTTWLNDAMKEILRNDYPSGKYYDMHGKALNPVNAAKTFLRQNLPANMKIESVKFSLGWLKDGSETTIDLPQPKQMAYMEPEDLENEKYPAFTDLPVKSKSFSFAGLGSQAHLVSTRKFQDADGKHICSIVKIDCTLSSMEKPDTKINYVACCQPYSQADNAPRGAMTLRFDGIPVPGLLTWSEFLSNGNFTDNKVTNLVAVNGDYPLDDKSKMLLVPNDKSNSSTTQQFAQHFYNWLRNGHSRPRIDSIMTMLNEPFLSAPNQVYTYEFAKDGSINRTVADGTQFARPVSSDGQAIAIADTHIKSGASAVIFFRDNVTTMNTRSGKHGGQPLAGYPLHDSGHNSNSTDSKELTTNFSKRTKYEDGLALDIEIGGTTPSTAMREVLAMRKLANRKI